MLRCPETQVAGVLALWKLCTAHENRKAIAVVAVPSLVDLLGRAGSRDEAREHAVALLRALSGGRHAETIVKAGAIPRLVDLLASGTGDAKENAAEVLSNLCKKAETTRALAALAMPPLVELLASGTNDEKASAARALAALASVLENQSRERGVMSHGVESVGCCACRDFFGQTNFLFSDFW
mmetsp:Transcript_32760/g.104422  ORF Transcript_32760/g.104422 Transcript_32760/m.104422 type:complete len:182 (+) Transcript_32760:141-686(+)